MNKIIIYLPNLDLKTFTEQNAFDYCSINDINSNKITELNLNDNKLTDISGIRLFKNLEYLNLNFNKIKDISALKDLNKLKHLSLGYNFIKDISVLKDLKNLELFNIGSLELESNQINYINNCKNLKILRCNKGFKNMTIIKYLNKDIRVIK